jgi:hypothetical protein
MRPGHYLDTLFGIVVDGHKTLNPHLGPGAGSVKFNLNLNRSRGMAHGCDLALGRRTAFKSYLLQAGVY